MVGELSRWKEYEQDIADLLRREIYQETLLVLDYAVLDRQSTYDLNSQICQNTQRNGWGLYKSLHYAEVLLLAMARILGSIGLSVSLFLSRVSEDSELAVLNHPLCALILLALLVAALIMSSGTPRHNIMCRRTQMHRQSLPDRYTNIKYPSMWTGNLLHIVPPEGASL